MLNNGPSNGDGSVWERRARIVAMLIGQVGFPILVAGWLLLSFSATLERLTSSLGVLSSQIATMTSEQERTTELLRSLKYLGELEQRERREDNVKP